MATPAAPRPLRRLPLLFVVGSLWACGAPASPPAPGVAHPAPWDYDGIEDTRSGLTALTVPCAFDAVSGTATVKVQHGELAVLDAAGGVIAVNGVACGAARVSTAKRIDILEDPAAPGDQTVILDESNGLFGLGTSVSGSGVHVDLGATGTDSLKLQGSTSADTYTLGALGFALNGDSSLDVVLGHASTLNLVVSTGAGNDRVSSTGGQGTGAAYPYPLTIFGGSGNDTITGGSGDDDLHGGDGDDTLASGGGADLVQGELGNDTFLAGAASSTGSAWFGGGGTDVMDYSQRTHPLTLVMDATLAGSATGTWSGEPGEHDLIGEDIEVLKGGSGGDTLTGSPLGATLNGGSGNDTFLVRATTSTGQDRVTGGAGLDTIDYSARSAPQTITVDGVSFSGIAGERTILGVDLENAIGGSGDDVITGNASDNTLNGGSGDDTIYGLGGDDVLIGGPGNDTLFGGAGDDTFVFASATGLDGNDVVNCGAGTGDTLDYSARTAAVTIDSDVALGRERQRRRGDHHRRRRGHREREARHGRRLRERVRRHRGQHAPRQRTRQRARWQQRLQRGLRGRARRRGRVPVCGEPGELRAVASVLAREELPEPSERPAPRPWPSRPASRLRPASARGRRAAAAAAAAPRDPARTPARAPDPARRTAPGSPGSAPRPGAPRRAGPPSAAP